MFQQNHLNNPPTTLKPEGRSGNFKLFGFCSLCCGLFKKISQNAKSREQFRAHN